MSIVRLRVVPSLVSFLLVLVLAFTVPPAAASDGGVPSSKLRGLLAGVVERARPGELIPVSIVLADQLTGERLRAIGAELPDRDARRRVRVAALKEHARRTQAGLLEVLFRAREEGRARRIRPLWLSNVVAAELTREEILGWRRTRWTATGGRRRWRTTSSAGWS